MKSKKELLLCLGWAITTVALLVFVVTSKRIPTLSNGEDVVASVDGKQFTVAELYKELKTQGGYNVLNKLVDEYIISKEVTDNTEALEYAENQFKTYELQYQSQGYDFDLLLKQNGMTKESFLNSIMYEYNSNMLAENYIKSGFTDKEIQKYYDEKIYEQLTVRHILIKSTATDKSTDAEKTKAENEALEKAKDLIKKLEAGAKFEDLAKEYSEDEGTKSSGGLYSNFDKSNTDSAFFEAANKLKDGEYTKTPVKSQFGYHIILKVSNNGKPSLESVKETVLDGLLDEKTKEDTNAMEKAWIELRKKHNLNIVDSEIKNIYDSMSESLQQKNS